MKRARPRLAIGGGAEVDHLFVDSESLCGSYLYGGGVTVRQEALEYDDEMCKECAREAGLEV